MKKPVEESLGKNDIITAEKLLAEYKLGHGDTGTAELDSAIKEKNAAKQKTLEGLEKAVVELINEKNGWRQNNK